MSATEDDGCNDDDDSSSSSMLVDPLVLRSRKEYLHEKLRAIGIDADELFAAAVQSIRDPASGYDNRYGRSAIRAYRSFLHPKKKKKKSNYDDENNKSSDNEQKIDQKQQQQQQQQPPAVFYRDPIEDAQLAAAASRCARQIEFLLKRHASHETEWVRHHDNGNNNDENNNNNDNCRLITSSTTTETSVTSNNNYGRPKVVFPMILLLDNLRSAANVGSLFRTADATGCEMILTAGITPHPAGSGANKLRKASLGAELVVPCRHFATTAEAVEFLKRNKSEYDLVGMETTERSVLYTEHDFVVGSGSANNKNNNAGIGNNNNRKGVVLVLGNEVTGVDTRVLQNLDVIVEVPMFGVKNSLNVAACAPVVLYEILRQWTKNNNNAIIADADADAAAAAGGEGKEKAGS